MESKPLPEHQWLQQLVGDWTFTNEASMGPDQPLAKSSGRERVRALGDFWILCEGEGTMAGADAAHRSVMTLGFDPKRACFVGTFIVSMMDSMWLYERGTLDGDRRVLSLHTEGPSFSDDGSTARYVDQITIINKDERLLTSSVQQANGEWKQFMHATYHRTR